MLIFIGGREYNLDAPIGLGGEGAVYVIERQNAVKVYHLNSEISTIERKLKVLALCNSYANNATYLGTEFYAFPEQAAYDKKEIKFESICGFSMRFFPNCPTFSDIGYDLLTQQFKVWNSLKLTDEKAIQLIFNTFDVIERLHKLRIILGDINQANLLYNSSLNYPTVIDLDAAQVGQFPCVAYSEDYIDPLVQQQGKNSKNGYIYSSENDIFSIACVCFELFVGANPFFSLTKPPSNTVQNKEKGISILRYIHENSEDIHGVKCLPISTNESIKLRIETLRLKSPKLFDFFVSTFVNDFRINLMQTLNRDNFRHPAYIFYSRSGFDTILKEILSEREKELANLSKPSVVSSVNPVIPNSQSGFDSILKEILSEREKELANLSKPSVVSSVKPVISDSVFTKNLQSIDKSNLAQAISKTPQKNENVDQTSGYNSLGVVNNEISTLASRSKTKSTDSDQLSTFLKNYSIDPNDIIGSQ